MKRAFKILWVAVLLGIPGKSAAIFDGGAGYAQIPYLWEILQENVKRYKQLKSVLKETEESRELIRILNEGIDNAEGLLRMMPPDETGAGGLGKIREFYGEIPKGEEYRLRRSHDRAASDGLGLADESKEYAKRQESNADKIFSQARSASPKGAQRMTAQTGAQILHSLGRLIRINAQMLKIQGQMSAYQNKRGKDSARHFDKMGEDIKASVKKIKPSPFLGRF